MAEEKKPKIDLKARLGKGGAAPQAAGVGGMPIVPPPAGTIPPAPGSRTGGSLPVPGAVPSGFVGGSPSSMDVSNPLMAAAAPRVMQAAPPPPPQRIEVDELAVQEARKGARKQGLMAGLVAAAVLGAIGYIAGGAMETNKGRQKSVGDAKSLAGDVGKSRDQLKLIADKVEAGRNSLLKENKFPDALAKELGGMNVDFDGNKLAGVRFSGFKQETTSTLIEYITLVQTINDRKSAIVGLLGRLQKPITEKLSAGQKTHIQYAVFFGKTDPAKNPFALLAPLTKPIDAQNPSAIALPAEFTATDPTTRQNISAPKYASGGLDKPSAVYVLPKSMEAACPSETSGAIAQLGSQLSRVLTDVRGEQAAPGGDIVTESKPGLLERADKLIAGLNAVE
jgi:hypothetical protein